MANTTIRLRKSGVASNVPVSLELGELALNYADGKLYYKNDSGVITYISSGATTNSFATINANSSLVISTSNTDILSFAGANNITITGDGITKTVTIGSLLTDSLTITNPQIGASANSVANLYNIVQGVESIASNASQQALLAYGFANLAFHQANSAYDQANSGISLAQSAYDYANTIGGAAAPVDQYARDTANGANGLAQSAFDKANTANGLAQGAFNKANTALYANNGVLTIDGLIAGGTGTTSTYTSANGDFTEGFFYIEPSQNHITYNSGLFTPEANAAISSTPIGTIFNLIYSDNSTDTVTQTGLTTWFGAQANIGVTGFTVGSIKNIKSISWTSSAVQTVINSTGVIVGNVNVLNYTQSAYNTANGANGLAASSYNQANTATGIAQASFNVANTAYSDAIYLQGVNNTQNTSISIIQGVNAWQNTQISDVNGYAVSAFNRANNNAGHIAIIQGVDLTQNADIIAINQYAQSAYAQANLSVGVDATQNTRLDSIETINTNQNTSISIIEGVNVTQNTRLDGVEVVNLSQNTTITEVNQYAQSAYNRANNSLSLSGGTVTGNVIINGNVDVTGNITYTGNVTTVTITGNSGQFFGNTTTGFEALYAGIATGYDFQPATVFQITSNSDSYAQINHQNINSGTDASTDLVATADNGNENDTFIDMGINSSLYSNPDFNLSGPNDGYLYVHGNTNTGGGNLIFATMHQNDIIFAVQGQKTENEVMRITSANNVVIKNQLSINGKDFQSVNDTQNTNITAVNQFAQGGYNTANTAQANTVVTQGVDAWQNTQITLVGEVAQAAFDKANTGGSSSAGLAGWTVIDDNYTVSNNVQLIANTTVSGFTVTLPATPVTGNTVVITDGSIVSVGWSNNQVTVARNGSTILGYADDLVLNVSRSTATLVYDGGTWQVSSTVGPKGDTGAAGPAGATGNTGPQGAGANATQRTYRFTATNNQTIFVGADAYSQSLSYNVNAVSVYLNGVYLRPADDYVANNGTTIYLTSGTFANDALDVVAFESMSLTAAQNTIATYVYTASAGQTSFGGADINGNVLDYNYNNIFVTLNGLTLRKGVDYLEANTSYIALTSGAVANDELSIVAFGSFSVQGMNSQNTISSYYYTSTAGQTDFTGADIYGNTLSYMQDGLFVVRNGATLRNKIDYTATNGTTVSLATPTAANDEIAITAVGWFNVAANGYTQVEANNLFLTRTDANNIFATTTDVNALSANTYTKEQANTQFASTGKAIAMAIVFGG